MGEADGGGKYFHDGGGKVDANISMMGEAWGRQIFSRWGRHAKFSLKKSQNAQNLLKSTCGDQKKFFSSRLYLYRSVNSFAQTLKTLYLLSSAMR